MKTPEEYFQERVVLPESGGKGAELTNAEMAFVEKYLGLEHEQALAGVRQVNPREEDSLPGFGPAPSTTASSVPAQEMTDESSAAYEEELRSLDSLQLVGFLVDGQEFAVPITAIQEVIRYVEPTKLPAAPFFVSGMINLRGRVTPLVSLRSMLAMGAGDEGADKFIIVCKHMGLQVGLIISAVSTMYRASQDEIEWGIENAVGINSSMLSGLMKSREKLINILSVDRLVRRVLTR